MSLLDNEINLIENTNPLNKNFPEFSNSHEENNGNYGYFAFYNEYLLPIEDEQKRCLIVEFYKPHNNFKFEINIYIGKKNKYFWYSMPYNYIFNSELEEFEEDLKTGSYETHKLMAFKDKGKTKDQTKTKAYEILKELKNNPDKLYKLIEMNKHIPNIKYNLNRLKNL